MDPERLIGSFVKSALFGRRLPTSSKVALGVGAVGIALAALEHVAEKKAAAAPPPPGSPPPPPPPSTPPPPPPVAEAQAMLTIRAMVAAAYADGTLDEAERRAILQRLSREALTPEERAALERELEAPWPVEELVAQVSSPAQAEEVYAASLLAVQEGSPAEQEYLRRLAKLLCLDGQVVQRWHRLLAVPW